MHRATSSAVSLVLLAGLAGCQNAGQDRVLGITAASRVQGLAYFDANRSKSFDSTDTPMQGLRVYLSARGASDTLATAVSDAAGLLRFDGVPVGQYDVRVDSASAGDTVVVIRVDTSQIDLSPGDTVQVSVGVSYPLVTVAEARGLPTGRKVCVAGVALTGTNVVADTTAHVRAATGPLRLVRVFTGVFSPGDSILARGTVSRRDGEPVLTDVAYTTISDYLPLPAGSQQVTVYATGDTSTPVIDVPVEVAAGGAYAIAAVGLVADAYTRDTEKLIAMEFPTFVAGISAYDSLGRIDVDRVGEPIGCGGVTVEPGSLDAPLRPLWQQPQRRVGVVSKVGPADQVCRHLDTVRRASAKRALVWILVRSPLFMHDGRGLGHCPGPVIVPGGVPVQERLRRVVGIERG